MLFRDKSHQGMPTCEASDLETLSGLVQRAGKDGYDRARAAQLRWFSWKAKNSHQGKNFAKCKLKIGSKRLTRFYGRVYWIKRNYRYPRKPSYIVRYVLAEVRAQCPLSVEAKHSLLTPQAKHADDESTSMWWLWRKATRSAYTVTKPRLSPCLAVAGMMRS